MKLAEFFDGLLEHKRAEGMSTKTLKEYSNQLKLVLLPAVGHIELESLREIDADKIKQQGRMHGEFGALRGVVTFRQLLQYIKKCGFVLPFDWRDIHIPKVKDKEVDWLTMDEWQKVRNAFDLNWIVGLRDKALVEVLWVTGMRIGEALSLNRDSINWESKEADIIGSKKPYKKRKVYFNEESLHWVKQYLQMRNENCEPLFVSCTGQRATPCGIRRTIIKAMKRAGITKRIHPHLFRSTYVTNLLEGGANIKSVQYLCGHESERTTLRHYAAVNKTKAKEEHQKVLNKPMGKIEVDFVKELIWKRT